MSFEFPEDWYEEIDGRSRMLNQQKVTAEIERLRAELDEAVTTVRRWHRAALDMRDMSITGEGDIQDYYFNAAWNIPFYGTDSEPLPSQRSPAQ